MRDFMWNAVPNGGYALDPEERIEQARISGEELSLADQVISRAIDEARLSRQGRTSPEARRKERDNQN
jgi:hypothetical protein